MRELLRKHPVIALITVLIVATLAWGFWPKPVLVETVAVEHGPLTVTVEEEGRTRVIDRYVISAPVDGITCRLQLDVGDAIAKDQVLLTLSPLESRVLDPRSRAQAEARILAAESALRAAEEQARAAAASQQLAASELERQRPLLEKGLVSRTAYDEAETDAETKAAERRSADFKVEVAQYELKSARSVLELSAGSGAEPAERVLVRSPIDGRVLKIDHECAGPVTTGQALLEVGDPTALEVEVDVLSADAVKITPGMKVLLDRWGGDGPLESRVRTVEPVGFTKVSALGVEEQRVLVISDFTSPPEQWQRLGDGYRVEARFVLWHEDNVLQVPSSSLFRYHDGWAVFVADNGRAERRQVRIGQRNGLRAQILDGLKQGERVINHPSDDVEHGTRLSEL